jgi:hypothetical protein
MLQNIHSILIGVTEEGDAEERSSALAYGSFACQRGRGSRHGPGRLVEACPDVTSPSPASPIGTSAIFRPPAYTAEATTPGLSPGRAETSLRASAMCNQRSALACGATDLGHPLRTVLRAMSARQLSPTSAMFQEFGIGGVNPSVLSTV